MRIVGRTTRWVLVALLLPIAPLRGQQPPAVPPALAPFVSVSAPIVALTHVRVIDGTGAAARTDQTVILDGPRIGPVGPFASTTIPTGARVIDLTNHTVLPGLVGLHEHTYFGGVTRVTPMNVSGPLLYLAYGVTTAMTAGSMLPYHEVSLKRAVDENRTPGPRFLIAGPYLDGDASRNPMSLKVGTPEAARRAVRYWSDEGATWIKFLGAETREVLRAAIEEAHARGVRVTGHLCSVTFTEAATLGIDLLQHGFITNTDYIPEKQPDICPPGNQSVQADVDVHTPQVQATIDVIVRNRTAVASTLATYESFIPDHPLDSRALDLLADDTRKEVESKKLLLKTVPATEAKNRFGAILDHAQREPVVIRRQDRDIAVVLSMADYERLRSGNIQAFLDLRKQIADEAAANGLTEKSLNELLADDDA